MIQKLSHSDSASPFGLGQSDPEAILFGVDHGDSAVLFGLGRGDPAVLFGFGQGDSAIPFGLGHPDRRRFERDNDEPS